MTQQEIETALDAGKLEVAMSSGSWWALRRNGKTQVWKTRPGEFSIPVKFGLKNCARLTEEWKPGTHFRVKPE